MTTQLDVQGRRTIMYWTNQSGGSVALGDVVISDAAHDESFTTTTTAGLSTAAVGVVIEANGIASAAVGRVCVEGYVSQVNLSGSTTRGHFIKTHTVAKQAADAGTSRVVGVFAVTTTTSATPSATLFGMPDGSTGSAGSPGTPAVTLSTTNATGSAATLIATDATIAVFDATVPAALGTAAAGSAGTAARRDHVHPTFTTATNQLSGDVTATNANQFYDGPSLATTGTNLLIASILVDGNGNSTRATAKLWDGTTVVSSGESLLDNGVGAQAQISLVGVVTASATYKVSVAFNSTGSKIRAAAVDNGAGNNASTLVAVKLA